MVENNIGRETPDFETEFGVSFDLRSYRTGPPEPVDLKLVRRFCQNELSEEDSEWIGYLIATYQQWAAAHKLVILETSDLIPDASVALENFLEDGKFPEAGKKPNRLSTIRMFSLAATILVAVIGIGYLLVDPFGSILINDGGHELAINKWSGDVDVSAYPAEYRSRIESLFRERHLIQSEPLQTLKDSLGERGLASFDKGILVSPVGTVVLDRQPVFSWLPVSEADAYRLRIYQANVAEPIVEWKTGGNKKTHWQVDRQLDRGKTYWWSLTVEKTGEPPRISPSTRSRKAKFMVASVVEENELESKLANVNSKLVRTLLFIEYGCLGRASDEIQQLSAISDNNTKELDAVLEAIQLMQNKSN